MAETTSCGAAGVSGRGAARTRERGGRPREGGGTGAHGRGREATRSVTHGGIRAGRWDRVARLIALVVTLVTSLLVPLVARAGLAEAAEDSIEAKLESGAWNGSTVISGWGVNRQQAGGTNQFAAAFRLRNGGVAYCTGAQEVANPAPDTWHTYARQTKASPEIFYAATHGYPATNTIGGTTFNDTDARFVTQVAIWHLSGTVGFKLGGRWGAAADALASEARAYALAGGQSRAWYYSAGPNWQSVIVGGSAPGRIRLRKASSDTSVTDGNACYSLAGAEYGVYADEGCMTPVATLVTDANGEATSDDLEVGTYWVRERKPSSGYALDDQVHRADVGDGITVDLDVGEHPQGDPVDLVVAKVDEETGNPAAQGDGTLAGAEFTLRFYAGNFDEGSLPGVPTRSWVLRTDDSGHASLAGAATDPATYLAGGDDLYRSSTGAPIIPLGTVTVQETKASPGYLVNDALHVLHVTSDGMSEAVSTYQAPTVGEPSIHGGIAVGKVERESGSYKAQGGASLEDAEFTIWNRSGAMVEVLGVPYDKDQPVMTIATKEEDGRWVARTGQRDLPYGTYEVRETKAPVGQDIDDSFDRLVEVREDGKVYDFTSPDGSDGSGPAARDQVWRQDLSLTKRDASSMGPLVHVPFMVTSRMTGEHHVVVTDENGNLSTAASWNPHTQRTNANDAAVAQAGDGSWKVDEAKLDGGAGVWFTGYANGSEEAASVAPDDTRGALPYDDSYTVEELPCSANEGRSLISFDAAMLHDGRVADLGTLDDRRIRIATSLTAEGGGKLVPAEGEVRLIDTVGYQGLDPDQTYRLEGTIHLVGDDGTDEGPLRDADGREVACSTPLSPQLESGSADVAFDFDASGLGGRRLVAFERLYRGDEVVATHEDIGDEGQTVYVPRVSSTLADAEGNHEAEATDGLTLVDQVAYQGLEPGREYTLTGTLHLLGEDGGDEGPARGDDGSEVTAQTTFRPDDPDGMVQVTFTFDATGLAGRSVVAFENLTQGDRAIATHADITDRGQTVSFPGLATSAADAAGNQESVAVGDSELVDTVAYANLVPGQEYQLAGTLHLVAEDGTDAGALAGADGQDVTAEATFTPEEPNGTVQVTFRFDASGLAGRNLVAFEELTHEGRRVAAHADISDTGQTISFPQVHTTALGKASGTHEELASQETTVQDTVVLEGLVVGHQYTVDGTLHLVGEDGGDAGPLVDGEGKPVVAQATLVAEGTTATVTLDFTFDASQLLGRSVVAFEDLSRDGRTLCAHADITDQSQTVRIPALGTSLATASGDKEADAGTVDLTDTVAFAGLAPGDSYALTGTLHLAGEDGSDQGAVLDAKGQVVTSTVDLTPQGEAGTTQVTFAQVDLAQLAGRRVVAFEELANSDGTVVARHADMSDEGQTVTVRQPPEEVPQEEAPQPKAKPAKAMPQTGVAVPPAALVVSGCLVAGGAGAWLRGSRGQESPRRRRRGGR